MLHGPGGQIIYLNPDKVTNLRKPHGVGQHFPAGTRCLVFLVDGKYLAAAESCEEIRERLQERSER